MLEIAKLIPAEIRKKILLENWIKDAIAVESSNEMVKLITVWKQFIEPSIEITCNRCYNRVLNNYKQLEPVLIELEKKSNLVENA